MEGLGWVLGSRVGEESLGLEWTAYGGCKGPSNSEEAKDGYGGPDMGVNDFVWVWRT